MRLVNFDSVVRGHNKFLAENERLVNEELERAGRHATDHVKRFPLFKPKTGKLQGMQRHRVIRLGKSRRLVISNAAKYANAIDKGSKPHRIVAKFRNKLRFIGRDGRFVFREAVNHPGNRPFKFGFRATNSAYRVLGQGLRHRMKEAASRF